MANSPSQYILLCEDKQQEVFVRRFLKKGWGITDRAIRVLPYPAGHGAGEQFVRENYPDNLKAFRTRHASTTFIAVIDADTKSVLNRSNDFDQVAETNCIAKRSSAESVLHIIPKRNIETWLAYLSSLQPIDEGKNYKSECNFTNHESLCWPLVDRLIDACKNNQELPNCPESLGIACREFNDRLRNLLNS